MSTTSKSIVELARDYAEGSELSAALDANAAIVGTDDPSRKDWEKRWLDLPERVRHRELAAMERELRERLAELCQSKESAECSVPEALGASEWGRNFFDGIVRYQDPDGNGQLSLRWAETKEYWLLELEALKAAADAKSSYAEADGAVALALARSQAAQRYHADLRRTRITTAARTFLFTVMLMVVAAVLLHFQIPRP